MVEVVLQSVEEAEVIVCYVTCPDPETADKIASHLVSNNLAACCNILPQVKSVYKWEG